MHAAAVTVFLLFIDVQNNVSAVWVIKYFYIYQLTDQKNPGQ